MSTKDWWVVIGVLIAGVGLLAGLMFLLVWDNENDKRKFNENCADIAKTIGVEDYHTDGWDCYVIKDGKIKEIKL